MKKIRIFIMFLVLSVGLYTTAAVVHGASVTGEQIRRFDSQITINKNGTIDVLESIDYDFNTLSRHGIYRTLPLTKTNKDGKTYKMSLQVMSVTDEKGNWYKYDLIGEDNTMEIKIGDPNKTITGFHNYTIKYTVSGALTYFSDHDELYWNVNGNDWKVPIGKTTVQVSLPQEVTNDNIKMTCYTGSYGISQQDCGSSVENNIGSFSTKKILNSGEALTIVVGFPKNIVTVIEPKPVVASSKTLFGRLFSLAMILLVTFWYVFYPFIIIFKWFKSGRDPKATVGVVTASFDPPRLKVDRPLDEKNNRFLTPGEVGTLGDETVDMKDISATIIDLARRGYLRIEERKKGDYFFVKTKDFSGLLSFEKKLLTGFFENKKEIRLKNEELYETVNDVKKDLYEDVVSEGLFPKNPQSIRTFYTVISVFALFTANFFLAAVAFLFGRNMPRKTLEGVNAYNIAKSLKNFLTSQERQLEFQAKNQLMFEKLLPYAIAFGVEKIWAKRFETINLQEPNWYRGYGYTQFNSIIFANSLNSSMSSFRSSATPPSSTTSSSGFSSGFSGGFSGGGGGGGGGGSW